MNNFFQLLKIQFFTNFKINKLNKKSKGKRVGSYSGIALYGLFFAVIIGFMGYTYTQTFGQTLTLFDKANQVLSLIIAISTIIAFMFSFYSMTSVLFNFKDYEMLCSMPIKRSAIVGSKLAYAFITDFLLSILIVIGCFFSLTETSIYTLDVLFVLKVLLLTIVSPFFALTMAMIIGILFAYIASKFRRKNVIQIILLLLFMFGYFGIMFVSNDPEIDMTVSIGKIFFIYDILNNAITGDAINILYYALICVAPFAVVSSLVVIFYGKLNAIFSAKKTLRNFKLKKYNGKSEFRTLLNKETKRLFSSPVYAINALLGAVMGLLGAIVCIVVFTSILGDTIMGENANVVFVLGSIALGFVFMLSPTTNCSISLEGRAYWLIKTSPIKTKNWLLAKLVLNAIFYTPTALIIGVGLSIALKANLVPAIMFSFIALFMSMLSGIFGLFANILFPHLSWENENQAVKQGMGVFLTVMSGFVIPALFFVVFYFTSLSLMLKLTIYLAFLLVSTVALYIVVFTKGISILDKRIK